MIINKCHVLLINENEFSILYYVHMVGTYKRVKYPNL